MGHNESLPVEEVSRRIAQEALDADKDHTTISQYPNLALVQIREGLKMITHDWTSSNIDDNDPDAVAEYKAVLQNTNRVANNVEAEIALRRTPPEKTYSENEGD